jgi:hypothetical protein
MTNAQDSAPTTVLVSDLSRQIEAFQVRLIFEPYGTITDLVITEPIRPVQVPKAVITFQTHEQAQTRLQWSVQQGD